MSGFGNLIEKTSIVPNFNTLRITIFARFLTNRIMAKRLSFIIPAYNEAKTIHLILNKVKAVKLLEAMEKCGVNREGSH